MRAPCVPLCLCLAFTAACAERHQGRGLVLQVDSDAGSVIVSHDPIPGFMDAMVMPLAASRPRELEGVRPGDRIQFRLTVGDRSTIDRVTILSAAPEVTGRERMPDAAPVSPIGHELPDFTLTDQDGRLVSLRSLRGKVVVASFIYTRCPLPDYCPRVMTTMSAVRDRFADRLGNDLVLLTITFDPQHDTPERLKAYARRYGADLPGWRFLTGSSQQIARVCSMLGVEYWPEEGMITHTLRTVILDRQGRLAASAEGKENSARQITDLTESTIR